ncbi:hypothetical protein PFISCL1PPCAC_21009, partial [Pristionchus fissidentatus]
THGNDEKNTDVKEAEVFSVSCVCVYFVLLIVYLAISSVVWHFYGFQYVQLRSIIETAFVLPSVAYLSVSAVKNTRTITISILAVGIFILAVGSYVISVLSIEKDPIVRWASIVDSATLLVVFPVYFILTNQPQHEESGESAVQSMKCSFAFTQLLGLHTLLVSVILAAAVFFYHYEVVDDVTIDAHLLTASWILCLALWKVFPRFEINQSRGLLSLTVIIPCISLALALLSTNTFIKFAADFLSLFQIVLQWKLLFSIEPSDLWKTERNEEDKTIVAQ